MDKLSKVHWIWDFGKVKTNLTYESGKIESRVNDYPPPTRASHDIAHFICGLNGNLEWDYELEPNHISEYNAVFLEVLLTGFCHNHYYQYPIDIDMNMKHLSEHMKWFAEDYYKISTQHPSKKIYRELKNNFLEKINFKTVSKHFLEFYRTWVIEEIYQNSNFRTEILIDSELDYKFSPIYNYLIDSKKILLRTYS